jgi:hypothetical protein
VLLHGTAAALGARIAVEGLREPMPGRGVLLTGEPVQAIGAAWFSTLKLRAEAEEHRADSLDADGLVCHVNVDGLPAVVVPADTPGWGPWDVYVVRAVPRSRITFERLPLALPPRGSAAEIRALRLGMARRMPSAMPAWEVGQQLVADGRAQRVTLNDEHRARLPMADYIASLPEPPPAPSGPLAQLRPMLRLALAESVAALKYGGQK